MISASSFPSAGYWACWQLRRWPNGQTQFVQVRYAARHNQRRQTALPLPLAIVLRAVDAVQTAVLATLATLPVLLLHGMAASGAAVPANLLVVWLLGPALRLGILALVLSFVPVLDPLFHGARPCCLALCCA